MAATFYVLPSRTAVAQQFSILLGKVFPGIDFTQMDQDELSDTVTSIADSRSDVFVVHREEVGDGEELEQSLVTDYGADLGDQVVELNETFATEPGQVKIWNISIEAEIDIDDEDEDDDDFDDEEDFDDILDEETIPAIDG